jgi:small-conductance mechanosensitive channel
MFNTRLRTGMGEEVTLSNANVFSSVIRNYSRTTQGEGYVLDTTVTIGYDTPWRQVEAMLLEAASRTSGISAEPPPRVFQTALSDFYPEYRLVCNATPKQPRPRAVALSDLHANIQDVFNQFGVQIMSPHYMHDPQHEKIVAEDRKYAAPAKKPE